MIDFNAVKSNIQKSYRELKNSDSDEKPTRLAGYGKAPYIHAKEGGKLIFNSNGLSFEINEGVLEPSNGGEKTHYDKGSIRIEGIEGNGISAETTYNGNSYIFSRDGLLKTVAEKYPVTEKYYKFSISKTIKNFRKLFKAARSGDENVWEETFEKQRDYWPRALKYLIDYGDFKGLEPDHIFKRLQEELEWSEFPLTEWCYMEEKMKNPIKSARTVEKVFDNNGNCKSLIVLKSIDPFLLSKPEEVRIQGRDLKVYEGDEKTPRILNGNYRLNLSLNELYVPLPALIKSKKTESVISKSHIRRSDGITKIPDAVLFNSDSEIYVENAGTVNIRKGVPDVLEVFRYLPLITAVGFGIGFGAGIGIGALMRNISLNTIVFAGAVGGAVYSSFWIPFLHLGEKIKNLEKRVFGDGDMSFWMKGEELY